MDVRSKTYQKLADHIIKNMAPRNFKGIYCQNKTDALRVISELVPEGSSVSWGGSKTLQEIGFFDFVNNGKYQVFNRDIAFTPDQKASVYEKIQNSDYFFLSTNAITLDGELVNIDGRSDRISFMCYGPKNIVIVAGMNKVATDVDSAIKRIRLVAAPMNAAKNGKKTPCAISGICKDCLADECICSNILISRRCSYKSRVTVILIGEELGF